MKLRSNYVTTGIACLHAVLLFAGCYVIVPAVLGMEPAQTGRYFAGSLWFLAPVAFSLLCIRKIKQPLLYLLAGAAVTVGMKLLSGSLLTVVLTSLIFLMRGHTRIRKGKLKRMLKEMPNAQEEQLDRELREMPSLLDTPQAQHWLIFAVYYVILLCLKKEELLKWILYVAVADVFLVFVSEYLSSLRIFLEEHEKIANLPKRSVKKAGQMLLALMLPLLFAFVLPSLLSGKEPFAELEFEISDAPAVQETEAFSSVDGAAGNDWMNMLREDVPETPAWMEALSAALMWILMAIILAFCVVLLYRLCRQVMKSFAAGGDDKVYFSEDSEEEQAQSVPRRKRRLWQPQTDAGWKIRRQYKKAIRKHFPGAPGGWETPDELEEKANVQTEAVSEELHELYEKARYGRM